MESVRELLARVRDYYKHTSDADIDLLCDIVEKLQAEIERLRAHYGDPCMYCGTAHDEVAPGPCPATRDTMAAENEQLRQEIARLNAFVQKVRMSVNDWSPIVQFELKAALFDAIGKSS